MHDVEPNSPAPHRPRSRGDTGWLAILVLVHLGVFVVFTSWAFGGQAPWVRQVIAGWGGAGVLLFAVTVWLHPKSAGKRALRWLWPLLLFDLIVAASSFNPSFKELVIAGESSLVMGDPLGWLPSSAQPTLAWRELWQFNVIVLSCFNVILTLQSRRLVRVFLFIISGNAVVLAVFGTFQKLSGASGLWFGLVPSPNPRFFSTFIYHNHWGAFTLLNTAVCLGLLHHYIRRGGERDFWHSPVLLGLLATLLLAASIPLSASRSSTVLMTGLLTGALIHFLVRLIRHRHNRGKSALAPAAGIILAAAIAVAGIAYLGRNVIAQRVQLTSEQLAAIAKEDTLNSRLTLYRDTWRMAAEKPWFGWGLESYPHVFRIFNTQRAVEAWVWIPFYRAAHNDWLQSLAETGFIGTSLRALLILIPLFAVPWRRVESGLPRYLLAGNGVILLYAWLEFPFPNPAVMLTFCAVFYCAICYATLDQPVKVGNPH